jgi:predicted Zn-dependent peptidase
MTAVTANGASFEYAAISNGIRVAVQERQSPVATIVCCVTAGARHDVPRQSGITHLLEHVLLLDSPRRASLPRAIEALGGEANGYTGKEEMILYCRVPADDVATALDLLASCICAELVAPGLVLQERAVVLEELRAAASDPASVIHDLVYESIFEEHGLASALGGWLGRVRLLDGAAVERHKARCVHAGTVAFVVTGGVETDAIVRVLEESAVSDMQRGAWNPHEDPAPAVTSGTGVHRRRVASDYVYAALATPGFDYAHRLRPAADVLAMLVGGCSDSVLYRGLRSERGLAYILDCWHRCYRDAGLFRTVFAVNPENAEEAIRTARMLVEGAFEREWTADELDNARRQTAAQLSFEWETPVEHAIRLARHAFVASLGDWQPSAYADAVAAVEPDDVSEAAQALARPGLATVAVGATDEGGE